MRVERYRRQDGGRRSAKLIALWCFITVALGGFGAAAVMMAKRAPDAFDLCQRSAIQASAATMVVVDPTDVLTKAHRSRVKTTIEAERDRLPQGGRLTILVLNPAAPWEPIELASVCNPGTAAQANPLFVTRKRIEERWRSAYAEPIDKAIAQASSGLASPTSPIIVTVAATLARPDFDSRVRQRTLVVISDLLEHEKGVYSQLRGGDFWSSYRASRLVHSARLDLRGVAVVIDYLTRGEYAEVQGLKHREFWQRLFREAGAAEVSFVGLQEPADAPQVGNGERIAKETRSR